MKLLLAAAFAFTAYTQQIPNLSSNGQIVPPIVLIEEQSAPAPTPAPVPETKENNVIQIEQKQEIRVIQIPLVGKQQFNPTSFVPETNSVPVEQTETQKKSEAQKQQKQIINGQYMAVDKHDHGPIMPGQQQFTPFVDPQPMPMPGQQEFNPTNFVPQHKQKHDKKKRDHELQKHQNQRQKHEEKKKRHEKQMQKKLRSDDKRMPQFQYNQDPASPQEWEDHAEQGHKKRKFHKKLWIPLTIVAVLFTLIGLLLGKCIRKLKKQKKCKRNAEQLANVTINVMQMQLAELEEKIKSKEQNLNKLREEYHNKKAMENSQAQLRAEQVYYNPHQMQMIQRIQPQQLRGYPQQQYPGYGQIPVGRPLQQM